MNTKTTSKTTNKKRVISGLLVCAMLLSILVGSFAYFTDRAETQATATAGTLAINLDDSNINFLDADNKDILNPGDKRTINYKVTNVGNKSTDIRETLVLSVFDREGNPLNVDGDATTQSQFDIYAASDVSFITGEGHKPNVSTQPLQVKSVNGNVITYVKDAYTLNGNASLAEQEIETDVSTDENTSDYVLVFNTASNNAFQGAILKFDLLVEAKQHRNTEAVEWIELQTETYILGNGNSLSVVAKVAGADASLVDHDDTTVYTYSTTPTLTINAEVIDPDIVVGTAVITGFKTSEDEADMIAADYYEKDGKLYRIVGIAASAFENNTVIVTVNISGNVVEIGDAAFKNASNLTDVTLHEGTETLGDKAFVGTSITEVEIPASVTTDVKNNDIFDDGVNIIIHTHSWDEGVITTPATCVAEGVKTYTCSSCHKTRTETISATGEHTYDGTTCTGCGSRKDIEDASLDWEYTTDDLTNTITLTSYTGESTEVIVHNAYKIPNPSGTITDDGYTIYENVVLGAGGSEGYISGPFYDKRASMTSVTIEEGVKAPVDASYFFYQCSALTTLNVSGLDTSEVTNMQHMFYNCSSLTSIVGIENFDMQNVTNTGSMFTCCSNLLSLDLSNWDTSSIGYMPSMFSDCSGLTTIDLSDWDFSSTYKITSMFWNCSSLTSVTISNWNMPHIIDVQNLFCNCSSLVSLDISDMDLSGITNSNGMFDGCTKLTSLTVKDSAAKTVVQSSTNFPGTCAVTIAA